MQVKCNWHRMGTIVLTVKRKNFQTPSPEAASSFILQKKIFIKLNYKFIGEAPNK